MRKLSHLELNIKINRPLESVWNSLVDWRSQSEWMLQTKVWSELDQDRTIKNGKNLSIDILNMETIDNIFFYKKDFNDSDFLDFINDFFKQNKVDIVLSDMAVNTTGNKDLDAIKTNAIALDVVNLSKLILKTKSALLVKIFSGKDENILIKNAKELFKKIE